MAHIAFDPRSDRLIESPLATRLANAIGHRILRFARRRRLEVALFGGLLTTLLGASLLLTLDPPAETEAPRVAPAPAWVDASKPLPMFAVDAPDFAPAPATYAMRRHSTGGGRQDILSFGQFADEGAYLRLVVHQIGGEGASERTLFLDTARQAADAGLALDGLGLPSALPTRFGDAEWADARLSAPGEAAARDNCAAFRFSTDKPELRVSGLACGPSGQPYNRSQLSCLIGRLDLIAAGDDGDLQKFFARSELARDAACPPSRTRGQAQAAPARRAPALRSSMRR